VTSASRRGTLVARSILSSKEKVMSRQIGLMVALVVVALGGFFVGTSNTTAQAPAAPAKPEVGRFQLSSVSQQNYIGAYVVDTMTGDVYTVVANHKPELVGRAGEADKK
jgi:hypothetical protein